MRHRDSARPSRPSGRSAPPAHGPRPRRPRPAGPICGGPAAAALALALMGFVGPAAAQQGSPAGQPAGQPPHGEAMARADAHFQAERWEEAAREYEAVLAADSTIAMAWYRLGRVRSSQGDHAAALPLFDAAERHGFGPVYIRFGKARALTALGREDAAVAELAAAAEGGFGMAGAITQDPGLEPLLDHAGMEAVLARVAENSEPCRHSPEARQLDFWVGSWDVFHPENGQKLGENTVEPMLKGCALLENWTGNGGSSGKSLNFFDPQRKTWRQVWVSDLQNVLDYRNGEFRDGAMRFSGITLDAAGDTTLQKLTFYDVAPDTVRQVMESSRDGGATWSTDWVGIYVRRAAGPSTDGG